jgi:hypothetical protein
MKFIKRMAGAAALSVAMLIVSSLSYVPAQAAYITTLVQQGSNVVANGSGTLNLASVSIIPGTAATEASIQPSIGLLFIGQALNEFISNYTGVTGPPNFGNGNSDITASSGSGDIVGVDETTPFGARVLTVPEGYVSGSALFESTTWNNQTFSSLGVTPGTYVWTWGSGASADSFTLNIEGVAAAVPEPSSFLLFGGGLAALIALRYRRATDQFNLERKCGNRS